jgi:hypothetical protein
MREEFMKKLALFAMLALASFSLGKGWSQPWTPRLPAWESVVYSCDYPKPYRLIAADDFFLEKELPVTNINWWGVVSDPDQLKRVYHITIYKESGSCMPAWKSIVWEACVKPYDAIYQGIDCQNKRVFKLFSNPPVGNPLTLGPGRYWIQISESDVDSVKPDATDFWWSSHQQVVNCPALQMDSIGAIFQPLIDPCNQRKDDLAFEIY